MDSDLFALALATVLRDYADHHRAAMTDRETSRRLLYALERADVHGTELLLRVGEEIEALREKARDLGSESERSSEPRAENPRVGPERSQR